MITFSYAKKVNTLNSTLKKISRVILITLILFSILTGTLFYYLEKQSYYQSFVDSNDTIVSQIASVYEQDIKTLQEFCVHSSLYSKFPVSDISNLSTSELSDLMDSLKGLNVVNDCIHSAYLYSSKSGIVYSSYSMPTTITKLEKFTDSSVFENLQDKQYMLMDPRFLDVGSYTTTSKIPLVITLLVALPANSSNTDMWLTINMDARKIYNKILNKLHLRDEINFYIVNDENCIIFCDDESNLFTYYDLRSPATENCVTSSSYSSSLDWTFVLERAVPQVPSSLISFYIVTFIILMLLLSASVMLTHLYMQPIEQSLNNFHDLRWHYFLTQGDFPRDSTEQPFNFSNDFPDCHQYVAMAFCLPASGNNRNFSSELTSTLSGLSKTENFFFHTIHVDQYRICAAIGFPQHEARLDQCVTNYASLADQVIRTLELKLKHPVLCTISSPKETPELLHDAWMEIREVDRYSLSLSKPIRFWFEIKQKSSSYAFPESYEKQLIDNLLVGNGEACRLYSDRIFSSFLGEDYILEDSEIYRYLYLLQNNILSHLAALPIPIQIPASYSPDNCIDLTQIKNAFNEWLDVAICTVNARNGENNIILYQSVIEYLNQHYTDKDICLNNVADYFGLNSNYVSHIIRESTKKSFSSYITYKRIQRSKDLLTEKKLNINEIAATVGFSYSYYFIRKFKEQEGITPGQYASHANKAQ